ncbi:MAG: thioredoxin family protein [Gaiellaceae bacterium]
MGDAVATTPATRQTAASRNPATRPGLVFFHSNVSGKCRRVEGYIAQVLQRRRNHGTFRYYAVAQEKRPDLVAKFGITRIPTLVVVEDKTVRGRLEGPNGCRDIEQFLSPWLQ